MMEIIFFSDPFLPVFGMIITVGQACAYVWSGIYGSFSDLGFGNAALIVAQLTFAGIIVLLLVRISIIMKSANPPRGGREETILTIN